MVANVVSSSADAPAQACKDCHIGANSLYGETVVNSPKDVENARAGVRRFRAREMIFHENSRPDKVYTLQRGWACRYKLFPDGRRHILAFIVPGDTILAEFVFAGPFSLPFSVKTITECQACLFDISGYVQLCSCGSQQKERIALARDMYSENVTRRQIDLARRSGAARVANLLLELERRLNQRKLVHDGYFDFPLTQSHIADATGLTPQHVNRVLGEWKKQGIVELDSRRACISDANFLTELGNAG